MCLYINAQWLSDKDRRQCDTNKVSQQAWFKFKTLHAFYK